MSAQDLIRSVGLRHVLRHKLIGGGLLPFISSIMDLEKRETDKLVSIIRGETNESLAEYLVQLSEKFLSGLRYDYLVNNLGKQLFGSAKFKGEKKLGENDFYTFTYIPHTAKGPKKAAVFHVGGVLPYSDRLFRFLPETNFYDRFLEAGVDVFAMELKGDIFTNPAMKKLTVEKMIDSVHYFSDIAFKENGNEKMIIEGYCGLGMQAVSSVLADVDAMSKKFGVLVTMVSPIDGRSCNELSNIMNLFPKSMMFLNLLFSSMQDEVVKGDNLRRTIDIAIKSFFDKTAFGRFIHGYKSGVFSNIKDVRELDEKLQRDLAGSYWISPENAAKYPVPLSLSHFSTMLFTVGVTKDGVTPIKYKGKRLDFKDLKKSDIKMISFYGELDGMVPPKTCDVLIGVLGDQFQKVSHAKTGHVSYILSPERWDESNPKSFQPGVLSTILSKMPKSKTTAASKPKTDGKSTAASK
jgi:hypothetical protein